MLTVSEPEWQVNVPFVRSNMNATPNSRGNNQEKQENEYYKAMFVAFASLRRFHSNLALRLITNEAPPLRYQHLLQSLDVAISYRRLTHFVPTAEDSAFGASLYYLDAMEELEFDYNVLLDPDVLCVGPMPLKRLSAVGSCLGLPINYPVDRSVNGLSTNELGAISETLGSRPGRPVYYGGEMYVLPRREVVNVRMIAERAWSASLELAGVGAPHFHTEEHVLSYVFHQVGAASLDTVIKRIWTTHRYRNVAGDEKSYVLWHLPAEKGRGFNELFSAASHSDSWFWQNDTQLYLDNCARIMGLENRDFRRWSLDVLGRGIHKLSTSLRGSG